MATTSLKEVVKIPMLLDHFTEHKLENPKLSFLDFLTLHYANTQHKGGDCEKDLKLPFKSIGQNIVVLCFLSDSTHISPEQYSIQCLFKKLLFFHNFSFITRFVDSIWQPPKV